ncbi:hypothetical protein [Flavobacterium sp.]|uniref:hypothetical protein n=1 Tax=Flavobacterium sp. TaxID=239 RepID=UPI00286DCF6A|nr:hypothetical protein [Flavobacterium sp.]
MNKFYKIGVVSLLFFSAKAQTNLLVNGGFEGAFTNNTPAGWVTPSTTLQTSVSSAITTIMPQEGAKALKLSVDQVQGILGDVSQIVPAIVAGSKYDVSFFYKYKQVDDGSGGFLSLQWFDTMGDDVPPLDEDAEFFGFNPVPYLAKDIWLPFTTTVTAPATTTQLLLVINCGGATDFVIDNAKVIKQAPLGINTIEKNTVKMYAEGNSLYVATQEGEQVGVYNLMGQKVTNTLAQGNTTVTVLNDLPLNQMLIVKVDNKSGKVILK